MIEITKYYLEVTENVDKFEYEADLHSTRPAWIWLKNDLNTKARFIYVRTDTDSGTIYKRFTGNFYYPIDQTKEEEKKFYDKYATYYDANTAKNNLPMAQFLLNKLKKHGVSTDSKILDLGAGTGLFSNIAFSEGYKNLTLMDIYQSMLDVAKTKVNLKDCNFIIGDVRTVELKDTWDTFVSVMMFDSLDSRGLKEALNNLNRHLSENGLLFVIEDKERPEYNEYFDIIEKGIFDISKEKKFSKYYFVGKKK